MVSPRGFVVNLGDNGVVKSVFTVPGFLGATKKGARHGDTRERIVELYGLPKRQMTDAAWWYFDDVYFWFDGFGHVRRIHFPYRR